MASGRDAVHREGKEVRQRVVTSAHVVACTLSSAGGELAALLPPDVRFDALIIDEARSKMQPACCCGVLRTVRSIHSSFSTDGQWQNAHSILDRLHTVFSNGRPSLALSLIWLTRPDICLLQQ